jgi:glycosyltransferase involved in cell wall biosynthesis
MKISILSAHLRLFGGIRRTIELSNNLVRMGHDVTIYHTDGSDCKWMKVEAKILPLSNLFNTEHDILIYLYQENREDFWRAKARHRYFYCCNLYNRNNLRKPLWLLYFIDKRAFKLKKSFLDESVNFIVNCTDMREWLQSDMGISSEVVFGGINKEIFHPIESAETAKGTKVLCAGGAKHWKGTWVTEQAVKIIKKTKPEVVLETFYNKGFPQSKMAEVYSSANIFADAQIFAGWNNLIAEAMACKVPVVCTGEGFNKDIAINMETALVVEPQNPEALAKGILRLMEDVSLREKLVENAYRTIGEFTWEKAAQKLENILKRS